MKKIALLFVFTLVSVSIFAQVQDFKVKNSTNSKERTQMLDVLRDKLKQEYKQECVFVVNHFKVNSKYAWFMGTAQRKDGKAITFPAEEACDCCHVETLFKKSAGKWVIAEWAAFATDVWYEGLDNKYPIKELLPNQ